MSKWGLTYKGTEILTPEEWNKVVDALEYLDTRIKGGTAEFTGDGTTTSFNITHGFAETPTIALVGKAVENLPAIDHWTADETYITVTFESAPASGVSIKIWWLAIKL